MSFVFGIFLTIQVLISVSMGGLILIQRSEGGALGMGGGPSGFMSARGAGNLLTRLTAILAVLFFANSIGLTVIGNMMSKGTSAVDQVDTSKLTLNPASLPSAPSQSTSSAAPSLNDLPLANTPTAAPVQAAPQGASPASRPLTLPAPVKLPANSGLAPSAAPKDVSKAKAGIWDTSSAAPASSGTAKPASSAPSSQQ